MRKKMVFLLIAFVFIQTGVSAQKSKEIYINETIELLEFKASKTTNRAMQAMYKKLIRELPPLLKQLPLEDVKFYSCVKESLDYSKHLEFLGYIKDNPNYKNEITTHPNGKITIGRLSSLFEGSQQELEKFAKAAQRCK